MLNSYVTLDKLIDYLLKSDDTNKCIIIEKKIKTSLMKIKNNNITATNKVSDSIKKEINNINDRLD